MTVRELMAVLSTKDPAAAVVVTWETTCHELDPDSVYVSADGDVVIDADGNSYKEKIVTVPGWLRNVP